MTVIVSLDWQFGTNCLSSVFLGPHSVTDCMHWKSDSNDSQSRWKILCCCYSREITYLAGESLYVWYMCVCAHFCVLMCVVYVQYVYTVSQKTSHLWLMSRIDWHRKCTEWTWPASLDMSGFGAVPGQRVWSCAVLRWCQRTCSDGPVACCGSHLIISFINSCGQAWRCAYVWTDDVITTACLYICI